MGINDLHFTDEDLDELAEKLALLYIQNVTRAFTALESSPTSSWKLRSSFLRNLRTFAGTDNQRS